MKTAIILSAHTLGLGVIRALGSMGVPIIAYSYQAMDVGHVSKYVRKAVHCVHPEKDEVSFIELLLEHAKEDAGSVLFPADDQTLSVVSRHKAILDQHYVVACTEWGVAEQFIDKKYTYALADRIGVPAPKTMIPASREEVEDYGRNVQYPCVVKPNIGHRFFAIFGKKMFRVDDYDQLLSAYDRAIGADVGVMLLELIPGDDTCGVNYNSYFIDGEAVVEFTAEKVRLAPPNFGVPRVLVSKEIPEIIEPGRTILRAMGFNGFSCTEFKKDERDGIYKIMDVNGRQNLSTLLSVKCGINFPWITYRHLAYGETPSPCNFRQGVYWIDFTKDVIFSLIKCRSERYSLSQYLRPYLEPHIFAILDWKDMRPFLKRCLDLFRLACQRLVSMIRRPAKSHGEAKI